MQSLYVLQMFILLLFFICRDHYIALHNKKIVAHTKNKIDRTIS